MHYLDTILQFITALLVLWGASMARAARVAAVEAKTIAAESKDVSMENSASIKAVVVATNGMKEALITATDKAAHALGKEEGRLEGEGKAATLAQGKLQVENNP